ncbi:hypothetical protein ACGF3J_16210 [Streptomyces sp. NPDC048171]|uniref:hypothetical protein n=1 Tax=unclassified Streptomyces TaxID=2593676 RepID=UPI0019272467|nr:hypothetical protein [Streptomyces sp. SID5789]
MALDHPTATSSSGRPGPVHGSPGGIRFPADERLPCARLLSDVWERARTGRDQDDAHTDGCVYCRDAVEGLTALDRATDALRTRGPSARALVERIVAAVRAEVRLGRLVPLDDPTGELRIAETTAAGVLRRAAGRVPGVLAASCRLAPGAAGTETRVSVAMTLSVTLDQPLPGRTEQVRRAVADAAAHELGLAVEAIDLRVSAEWERPHPTDSRASGPGVAT